MVGDFAEPRTAETVGRTEPVGLLPGGVVDRLGAALKFLAGFVGSAEEEIRMSLRVIAQQVAASGGFSCECGALASEPSHEEEGGLGVVLGEKIEKFRSDGRVRTVVKSERQQFWRGRIANRRTKELCS
jgi:hypothetical protein